MSNISGMDKLKILAIGALSSCLIFFVIFTFYGDILTSYVLSSSMSDQVIFTLLFIGLDLIALVASVIISFIIVRDVSLEAIVKAAILSLLISLFVTVLLSYILLLVFFPFVFKNITGFEIVLVWTQAFIYAGIYVFGSSIELFVISILIYYLAFIFLLEQFFTYGVSRTGW
jgi:hypothetical protein